MKTGQLAGFAGGGDLGSMWLQPGKRN